MSNATSGPSNEKIGVILVHGIGEAKPGEVISQTVLGLREHVTVEPYREMRELLDHGEEQRLEGDRASVDRASKWQMHKQRGRIEDGREFVLSEAYWSDLKNDSRTGLPSIARLLSVILKSNRVMSGVSRGRLYWTAYPIMWVCQLISWLLRGPILATNFLLAWVFLSLAASEYVNSIQQAIADVTTRLYQPIAERAQAGRAGAGDPVQQAAPSYDPQKSIPEIDAPVSPVQSGAPDLGYLDILSQLALPVSVSALIGLYIFWNFRRSSSFWREVGIWIAIVAVLSPAFYYATYFMQHPLTEPLRMLDSSSGAMQGRIQEELVPHHFFFKGMRVLFGIWLVSIASAICALILALLHFAPYAFSSFARSVYRRLFLAISVMSIQAVTWAVVTRPLWLIDTRNVARAYDLGVATSGVVGSKIEGVIFVALLSGSLTTNFFALMLLLGAVIVIFLARHFVTEGAHRIWGAPTTTPGFVNALYPRIILSAPIAKIISFGTIVAGLYALALVSVLPRSFLNFNPRGVSVNQDIIESVGNALSSSVALFAIFAVGALLLLNKTIGYAASVLEDIANYAGDRKHRRTANDPIDQAKAARDDEMPFRERPLWRQTSSRFDQVYTHLLREERIDRLLVVSHSQGTVVTFDHLDELEALAKGERFGRRIPVDIITLGSPLKHIYAHYFPEYMEHEARIQRAMPSLNSWTNMYRVNEAIGRRITSTDAIGVQEIPMSRGPHKDYWFDEQVTIEILRKIRGV